ncbi:MAG: hypothetical protein KBC17_01630 [Candidatus Pacebacteria bacterium]|nr:hypothetical protein [Candidatus Paceibacterota bacterium]
MNQLRKNSFGKDPRNEEELKSDYDASANSPIPWYLKAHDLYLAAEALKIQVPLLQGIKPSQAIDTFKNCNYIAIICMLRGMQIECLIKGILTSQGKITANKGKLCLDKKFIHHNLTEICSEINGLIFNDNEISFLDSLSEYIEIGRLPFKKTAIKKKGVAIYLFPSDEDTYTNIIKKLSTSTEIVTST